MVGNYINGVLTPSDEVRNFPYYLQNIKDNVLVFFFT